MVVKDNRIVECTEAELFLFWLKRWSDVFDYYTFKDNIKSNGVKVIQESE